MTAAKSHGWGAGHGVRLGKSGWERQRDNERILRRDGHRCYLCGGHATQVDHVRPLSHGGSDDDSNKRAICEPDHKAKTETEKAAGRAANPRPSRRREPERHPGMRD